MSETLQFAECDTCNAKSGSPLLCKGCLSNRKTINEAQEQITRLQKYVQHHPACAVVIFRHQSSNWVFVPEPPLCSCGLVS